MLLIKKMPNGMKIYQQANVYWVKDQDNTIVGEFACQSTAEQFCEDSSEQIVLRPRGSVL